MICLNITSEILPFPRLIFTWGKMCKIRPLRGSSFERVATYREMENKFVEALRAFDGHMSPVSTDFGTVWTVWSMHP